MIRKTLGHVEAPCARELKKEIESREKRSVCLWCIGYAQREILPIYERRYPQDERLRNTLEAALQYLQGEIHFKEVKHIILSQAHAAAREKEGDPPAQAAARAIAHCASAIHSKRHAMGIYFYGAAAIAYESLGTDAPKEDYEKIAQTLCRQLLDSIRESES